MCLVLLLLFLRLLYTVKFTVKSLAGILNIAVSIVCVFVCVSESECLYVLNGTATSDGVSRSASCMLLEQLCCYDATSLCPVRRGARFSMSRLESGSITRNNAKMSWPPDIQREGVQVFV